MHGYDKCFLTCCNYSLSIKKLLYVSKLLTVIHFLSFSLAIPGPADECAKDPCHEFADCTNVGSSYSCDCKDGYMGDGVFCMGMMNAFQKKFLLNVINIFLLIKHDL